MRRRSVWMLALVVVWACCPANAQSWPAVALETQAGYAIPRGGFTLGESGARPRAGPRLSLGARVETFPFLSVYGAYHRIRFGCSTCALLSLDRSMLLRGVEAGIDLRPSHGLFGIQPWLRVGGVYQTLGLSDSDDRMTSRPDFGATAATGAAIRIGRRFELTSGVRVISAPAEFEFISLPSRHVDVSAVALEIGAAVLLNSVTE